MGREQGHRPLPMGPGNRKVNESSTIFRAHIGKRTYLKELVQSAYCCTLKVHIGKVVHTSQKVHIGRLTRKWHFTTLCFPLTVATNIIHRGRRHFPSRGFTESLHPIRTTPPRHFSTKPVSFITLRITNLIIQSKSRIRNEASELLCDRRSHETRCQVAHHETERVPASLSQGR